MKILCVASFGGHLAQMERIAEYLVAEEVTWVTTRFTHDAPERHVITDFNKTNFWRGGQCATDIVGIIRRSSFDVVVSTGAAPGLLFLLLSRLAGRKTVWIDSVANCRRLSLSGRIAALFCHVTLSQWPRVASAHRRVQYLGSVL
ncbi:oligosaccharide biosynthesis protein Alg14 [Kushneria sp. EE4]